MVTQLSSGCFLGKVLNRRRFEGILLTETRHLRNDWLPTHAHQNAYFCLIRRGQFSERFGSRERVCKPGMLTYHPPQERHSERIESDCSASFNVELEPRWLQWATAHSPAPLESCEIDDAEQTCLAGRLHREFELNDSVSSLAIQGLTLELLAGLIRSQRIEPRIPAWLQRVRQVLHDRFSDRLEWNELATVAGVHPVYLGQCFRKHFHCTPGDYQRKLRIDWARQQLQKNDMTLAEIALHAGFADQSHLTRHFKQHTGLTPMAYRRDCR
ncbi:MAG: AraC family transcriptional regulator [Gemmatales bacterium]